MINMMTIVGARPQFIKAAAVSRVTKQTYSGRIDERIVHTGQHFDPNMSKVFFDQMDVPEPLFNLEISGGGHGVMTGRMLESLEKLLLVERPDVVLVYGDTNSTLAGALAAGKLHIPVMHVEAGLRSFNMCMPEEINRVLTDRLSSLLFCPTQTAVDNLCAEGIKEGVSNTGDVMFDAALFYGDMADVQTTIIRDLKLDQTGYVLVTCHRAENTDHPDRMRGIMEAIAEISRSVRVVFPLHPRTRKVIDQSGLDLYLKNVTILDPVSFLDMVALERAADLILTDSGGIQKEAFFYRVPCLTMRDETEWVETVELGANILVGASKDSILEECWNLRKKTSEMSIKAEPYGSGCAANNILSKICNYF